MSELEQDFDGCMHCGPETGKYPWRCGYCGAEWEWFPRPNTFRRRWPRE